MRKSESSSGTRAAGKKKKKTEKKNLYGSLLSSVRVRRQLTQLRQRDAQLAQTLFVTLCRPLVYAPCRGAMLLNRATTDDEIQYLCRDLSERLCHVDLRVLIWQEWRLLYLYNGRQVCLLSLSFYAGL